MGSVVAAVFLVTRAEERLEREELGLKLGGTMVSNWRLEIRDARTRCEVGARLHRMMLLQGQQPSRY